MLDRPLAFCLAVVVTSLIKQKLKMLIEKTRMHRGIKMAFKRYPSENNECKTPVEESSENRMAALINEDKLKAKGRSATICQTKNIPTALRLPVEEKSRVVALVFETTKSRVRPRVEIKKRFKNFGRIAFHRVGIALPLFREGETIGGENSHGFYLLLMRTSRNKWYIQVDGKKQGPYGFAALKEHPRISPFTLAKKKNRVRAQWKMMGQIPELAPLFQRTKKTQRSPGKKRPMRGLSDVLIHSSHLSTFIFWGVIVLVIILYIALFVQRGGR